MTDSTIANLPAASTLGGSELLYGTQGGIDVKITAAQLAALADGGVAASHAGYVASRWYHPLLGATVVAGATMTANVIRFHPVIIYETITVSELAARITTAAASQNIQFAIYAADATTKRPTGAALASTGNISTTSTGPVSGALGASVQLTPGLYFFAANPSGAPVCQVSSTANTTMPGILGSATLANIMSGNSNANISLTLAQTFGTWPDVTLASFVETSTLEAWALICFKVASIP